MIGNPVNTMSHPTASTVSLPSGGSNVAVRAANGSFNLRNLAALSGFGFLAGAADSAIGTLLSNAFAKRNAKILFDNWLKMFDYQAEYNSPANLLKRLFEAGINPNYNSEYGGSQSFQSLVGNLPTDLVGNDLSARIFSTLSYMNELRKLDIEKLLADSESEKNYALAGEAAANAANTRIRNLTLLEESIANIRALEALTNKTEEEENLVRALIALTNRYSKLIGLLIKTEKLNRRIARWLRKAVDYANTTDRYMYGETVRHNKVMEKIAASGLNLEAEKFHTAIRKLHWDEVKSIILTCTLMLDGLKLKGKLDLMNDLIKIYGHMAGVSDDDIEFLLKSNKELGMSYLELLGKAGLAAGAAGFIKGAGEGLGGVVGEAVGETTIGKYTPAGKKARDAKARGKLMRNLDKFINRGSAID